MRLLFTPPLSVSRCIILKFIFQKLDRVRIACNVAVVAVVVVVVLDSLHLSSRRPSRRFAYVNDAGAMQCNANSRKYAVVACMAQTTPPVNNIHIFTNVHGTNKQQTVLGWIWIYHVRVICDQISQIEKPPNNQRRRRRCGMISKTVF